MPNDNVIVNVYVDLNDHENAKRKYFYSRFLFKSQNVPHAIKKPCNYDRLTVTKTFPFLIGLLILLTISSVTPGPTTTCITFCFSALIWAPVYCLLTGWWHCMCTWLTCITSCQYDWNILGLGVMLWCLTPLSTICQWYIGGG